MKLQIGNQQRKLMKPKTDYLKRSIQFNKPIARLTKTKRQKTNNY